MTQISDYKNGVRANKVRKFAVDNAYTDNVRVGRRVHKQAKLATAVQLSRSRKELALVSGAAPLQIRRVRTLPLPRGKKPLHSSTVRRWAEQALWVRNDQYN